MLSTGNQLKAARALAGLDQAELASRAGVNVNTIGTMERRGAETLTSGFDVVRRVQTALEAAGVEFIPENGGGAGVRLKKVQSEGADPTGSGKEFMRSLDAVLPKGRRK